MSKKIALVCSSGGHLFQLYSLKEFWQDKDRLWISFPTPDAQFILKDEKVFWAYYPTNRNIRNLVKNLFFAWNILKKEKPEFVISTGAGISVPFIFAAKIFSITTIYIESLTRTKSLSLSGKMVYPIVDKLFVQWPELTQKYKKAQYAGDVM